MQSATALTQFLPQDSEILLAVPLCHTSGALVSAAAPWARGVRVPLPVPPTTEKWELFRTRQIQRLKSVWGSSSGTLIVEELLYCSACHIFKKG